MSSHTVLVVEDHEPFRRIVCELLQQRADVLIVGEAADGLDAIRQAETLRPDVVMLDIGLPRLSGIEVAGHIRAVLPSAKLVFVTNESSLDVVEHTFRRGAHGYVYKPRALRDLLHVFEAIVQGRRFVSIGLERTARGDSLASHRHDVLFYSDDAVFVDAFSRFIAGTLHEGSAVIVLVNAPHHESLRRSLGASGVDLDSAVREGRYVSLDISELLSQVMINGRVDTTQFTSAAEDMIAEAAHRTTRQHARLAACGECAPTLWAHGHIEEAIQLEHLWDEVVARSHQVDTLCAYPMTARQEDVRAVRSLCAAHMVVEIG
jgi:DNA-binding NarL/FixJ family response regulator